MTDITARLAELKAVAEKATPDEWDAYAVPPTRKEAGYCAVGVGDSEVKVARYEGGWFDAHHIATFDPPTVLALIAALEGVMAVHRPRANDERNGWIGEPFTDCVGCAHTWPCPTIRAITEALGMEAPND